MTPPDVVGGRPVTPFNYDPVRSMSPSGDTIYFRTSGLYPDAPTGNFPIAESIATRGPDGWVSKPIGTPEYGETVSGSNGPVGFSSDYSEAIWSRYLPGQHGFGSKFALERRRADGTYEPLWSIDFGRYVDASPDLSRVLFEEDQHLLPTDAARTQGTSIYELEGSSLRQRDVIDGSTFPCGSAAIKYFRDSGGLIFFGKPDCGNWRIYMNAGGQTTEISAPQCTTPGCAPGDGFVYLAGMTQSGSFVWIGTSERLTDEDTDSLADVYLYDTATGKLSLATARPPVSPGFDPPYYTVRPSEDGSRAYYFVEGQLLPGQGSPTKGNLYLQDARGWHYVGTTVPFEAELDPRWVVSGDGRYVFFPSSDQLLPSDKDANIDSYRYDAVTEQLTQVSLGSEGRGNGPFDSAFAHLLNHTVQGGDTDPAKGFVFETKEQLLPQDRNDVLDVYEWTEAGGLGLVSSGTPGFPAELLFSTADAKTVLFRTGATLLPRDRDGGEVDIYAARVGGGFPEPPAEPDCVGACTATPPAPAPHQQVTKAKVKPRLELGPIGAEARRQLLVRGHTTLLAEVPAAAKLTALGMARVGGGRQTVAEGSAKAKAAGPVRLSLTLTPLARRALARGDVLRMRLTLSLSQPKQALRTHFVLGGKS